MPKPKSLDLTRRESQIMEILHRRRRATVEEIRAELPDAPSPSAVRKLLDIMIDRGLLAREYDGPRFAYFPAAKPEDASRSALDQLIRTFFNDRPGSAMAALLESSSPLSAAEYKHLSNLLKRAREQGDELGGQRAARRQVSGHHGQEGITLGNECRDPVRHRGVPRAEVRHRPRDRLDELVQIEQGLNLRLAEHQHLGPPPLRGP